MPKAMRLHLNINNLRSACGKQLTEELLTNDPQQVNCGLCMQRSAYKDLVKVKK